MRFRETKESHEDYREINDFFNVREANRWLKDRESLVGKVRVWNLAAAPKQQPAPKLAYVNPIGNRNWTSFIVPLLPG